MIQAIKAHPDARAHVLSHKSFESFASCVRCKFLQRREVWRRRFRLDPADQTSETWMCEKFATLRGESPPAHPATTPASPSNNDVQQSGEKSRAD
eukprot:2254791-Pyramimonas_sp.AAC.1